MQWNLFQYPLYQASYVTTNSKLIVWRKLQYPTANFSISNMKDNSKFIHHPQNNRTTIFASTFAKQQTINTRTSIDFVHPRKQQSQHFRRPPFKDGDGTRLAGRATNNGRSPKFRRFLAKERTKLKTGFKVRRR